MIELDHDLVTTGGLGAIPREELEGKPVRLEGLAVDRATHRTPLDANVRMHLDVSVDLAFMVARESEHHLIVLAPAAEERDDHEPGSRRGLQTISPIEQIVDRFAAPD